MRICCQPRFTRSPTCWPFHPACFPTFATIRARRAHHVTAQDTPQMSTTKLYRALEAADCAPWPRRPPSPTPMSGAWTAHGAPPPRGPPQTSPTVAAGRPPATAWRASPRHAWRPRQKCFSAAAPSPAQTSRTRTRLIALCRAHTGTPVRWRVSSWRPTLLRAPRSPPSRSRCLRTVGGTARCTAVATRGLRARTGATSRAARL